MFFGYLLGIFWVCFLGGCFGGVTGVTGAGVTGVLRVQEVVSGDYR